MNIKYTNPTDLNKSAVNQLPKTPLHQWFGGKHFGIVFYIPVNSKKSIMGMFSLNNRPVFLYQDRNQAFYNFADYAVVDNDWLLRAANYVVEFN